MVYRADLPSSTHSLRSVAKEHESKMRADQSRAIRALPPVAVAVTEVSVKRSLAFQHFQLTTSASNVYSLPSELSKVQEIDDAMRPVAVGLGAISGDAGGFANSHGHGPRPRATGHGLRLTRGKP